MTAALADSKALERATRAGESPVETGREPLVGILSTTRHEKPCGKLGGPPSKAKALQRPIVNKYREGKVKSTPTGG
jgi:hypothetical protein